MESNNHVINPEKLNRYQTLFLIQTYLEQKQQKMSYKFLFYLISIPIVMQSICYFFVFFISPDVSNLDLLEKSFEYLYFGSLLYFLCIPLILFVFIFNYYFTTIQRSVIQDCIAKSSNPQDVINVFNEILKNTKAKSIFDVNIRTAVKMIKVEKEKIELDGVISSINQM